MAEKLWNQTKTSLREQLLSRKERSGTAQPGQLLEEIKSFHVYTPNEVRLPSESGTQEVPRPWTPVSLWSEYPKKDDITRSTSSSSHSGAISPPRASEAGGICPPALMRHLQRGTGWFLLTGIFDGMQAQAAERDGAICILLVDSRKHQPHFTLTAGGLCLGGPTVKESFQSPG